MGLKFFKRGTYDSVSNALSLIRQEFEALWAKIGDIKPGEEVALAEQQSYIPDIGSPASSGYKGMFKCEMYQKDESTTVVRIYDGANTFAKDVDIEEFKKHTAGQCHVNGRTFVVNSFYNEFDRVPHRMYYLLKYIYSDEYGVLPEVMIVDIDAAYVPSNDSKTAWYLLATIPSGEGILIQQHTSSMPNMFWFRDCNEVTDV